jgi:RNA polymerase sigma-70 factor (ECF subfamily)
MKQGDNDSTNISDAELIKAMNQRVPEAMESVYQRYEPILRSVIVGVIHDEAEADDVLHDVFLQVWEQSDRFVPEKGLQGFLVTLARRRALDRLRRRLAYRRATDRFEMEVKTEVQNNSRSVESPALRNDLSELLNRLIGALPKPQQEVVRLTYYEGMSQREIAARRAIALGTVKTRLQLAQRKLLNALMPVYSQL